MIQCMYKQQEPRNQKRQLLQTAFFSGPNPRPAYVLTLCTWCWPRCLELPLVSLMWCVPGVGRGVGVGQVGAAPADQRGEADDEADDPDQADQQLRPASAW